MDCKIIKFFLLIFFISFKSYAVDFNGKFIQGHYIIGKTDPNSTVMIDKKKVKVSKDGYFAFGLDREGKSDIVSQIKKVGVQIKIIRKFKKRNKKIKEMKGLRK